MPPAERTIVVGLNATGRAGLREVSLLRRALGDLTRLDRVEGREAASRLRLPRRLRELVVAGSVRERGEAELARAGTLGLSVTLFDDADYPRRLLELANPPPVLFRRGAAPGEGPAVAIVGSRGATRYGRRTAARLGRDLGAAGVLVVSGLARGIDSEAHLGALEAGGATAAVLGSGLANVYPPENVGLADRIAEAGALWTEFGPDAGPRPYHFPRRNRIIAGVADAVVLVEAREKSGGLITVSWAADLGRAVFVVPGQIDNPLAAGVLALLRDGATPIRHADDLLTDLGWSGGEVPVAEPGRPESQASGPSAAELRLLACLDHEPVPVDELLADLGGTAGQVLTMLLSLEVRGLVVQDPGLTFRKPARDSGPFSSRAPTP